MQRQVQMIAILALAVTLPVPVVAAEPGWTLRLQGAWVRPSVDVSNVDSAVPIDASPKGALGAGVALEYHSGRFVGLGLDALHARPEIALEADLPDGRRRISDSLAFTPFTLGPVFHLTPGKAVDLTVTAMIGVAHYGDLAFVADGETLNLEGGSTFAWGLGAAVDIDLGASNWALHAGVRRYASNPEFTNRDNGATGRVAINPIVVTFGVAYRF